MGRRLPLLEETAELINGASGLASCTVADVRDADAVQRVVDEVIARVGRIDVLINNAGVDDITPFLDVTDRMGQGRRYESERDVPG